MCHVLMSVLFPLATPLNLLIDHHLTLLYFKKNVLVRFILRDTNLLQGSLELIPLA